MEKDHKNIENKVRKHPFTPIFEGDMQELMANLLHNLPGMAYRCKNDADWTMLFLSERCFELTGYQPQELMHNAVLSYDSLIIAEDRDLVRNTIEEGVASGGQFQIEYRIETKGGKIKWVLEIGTAVYTESGEPLILDGFIRDISPRKKKDEQLNMLARELAHMNASKDRFFTLLAHDLQNPIYAVISLSEFMMDNCEQLVVEDIHSAFRQVNNSARIIHVLLENLLDWSKFQTGKITLQKEYVSLKQLISYAINQFKTSIMQKELEVVFDPAKDVKVYSDMRLISSIVRNFISNAIKYSKQSGKIEVIVSVHEESVTIEVIDEGVGIARKHLKDILSLNSELRQYGTANEAGSGLGLILSASFAKLIDGEIRVESKLNRGSKFTLELPLKID